MLEILGRIELLLYVPGMRGLSACWLDGDGVFGVGDILHSPAYEDGTDSEFQNISS